MTSHQCIPAVSKPLYLLNLPEQEDALNLQDIYDELKLTPEQQKELSHAVRENPMAAISLIQTFNIPPELIQKMIGMMMANPEALKNIAAAAGVSADLVDQVSSSLQSYKQQPD